MSGTLDVTKLMKALENEDNDGLIELDHKKIQAMKNDMLQKLGLPRDKLKSLHKSLKFYRYVDELPDIHYGSYVRWISLKNPNNIRLTNGGIVCDVKIDDGINVVCRNNMHRFFQFKMGECLVFQKLTDQEQVLLSALDYLNN